MVNFAFEFNELKRGDKSLWDSIRRHAPQDTWGPTIDAGRSLATRTGTSTSIDDLLHRHGFDASLVAIGKMAIAARILRGERESSLFAAYGGPPKWERVEKDWLTDLFVQLAEGVTDEHVEGLFKNLSVLTFNYDRVLEHHWFHTVQRAYDCDAERARVVMSGLEVHHAYGRLGPLPWERSVNGRIEFGAPAEAIDLQATSTQIRTFTEREDEPGTYFPWTQALMEAEQVIFMGFGFHRQNIDLLRMPGPPQFSQITSSTLGLSRPDFVSVTQDLKALWNCDVPINFNDITCPALVARYGRSWMSRVPARI